jgi:hypothetical protein
LGGRWIGGAAIEAEEDKILSGSGLDPAFGAWSFSISPAVEFGRAILCEGPVPSLLGVEGLFVNRPAHDLGAGLFRAGAGAGGDVEEVGPAFETGGDGCALMDVAVEVGDEGDGVYEVGVTAVDDWTEDDKVGVAGAVNGFSLLRVPSA